MNEQLERAAFEAWWQTTKLGERNEAWQGWKARANQPRFPMTYCSQCGCELGAGNEGVSSCKDHK